MWPAFAKLDGLPVAVVRGENSDLLSEATVAEMSRHVTALHQVTIADRGHTPFLTEPEALTVIDKVISSL